jgi:hypothetical protein
MCNLHMLVPVAARRHAKLAAVASGIPFRDFVATLLFHAKPISIDAVGVSDAEATSSVTAPISAEPVADCPREVGGNGVSGGRNASV